MNAKTFMTMDLGNSSLIQSIFHRNVAVRHDGQQAEDTFIQAAADKETE